MKFKKCRFFELKNCNKPFIPIVNGFSSNTIVNCIFCDDPNYKNDVYLIFDYIYDKDSSFSDYDNPDFYMGSVISDTIMNVIVIAPILYTKIISYFKPSSITEISGINEYNFQLTDVYHPFYNLPETDIRNQNYYTQSEIYFKHNTLNKVYHFFLNNCTSYDVSRFKYYYPEYHLIKYLPISVDEYPIRLWRYNLVITTNNKQFLKKCISNFNPEQIKIINRTEYKELTTNMIKPPF